MNHNINTSRWKKFKIGELFNIVKGRRLTKANMIEGNTNFIGSSAMNNGITAHIGNTEHIHDSGVLTVCYNGSVGETFYQPEAFWASDDVNILEPKHNVSRNALLFASTVIRYSGQYYDWTEKWTRNIMLETVIMLPSTPTGTPDWDYMDAYMSRIIEEEQIWANELMAHNYLKHQINVSRWEDYQVGKLFPMFKPPVLHSRQVLPSEVGIPYVVRTKFNNGIKDFVTTEENIEPSPAGVITWGAENATFFYQERPFYSGRDIYCLDTRGLNANICYFLVTVFNTIAPKYSYNDGLFPDLLKKELIKLPSTSSGSPDWDYMDVYITHILKEEKKLANELKEQFKLN